jgi:glutamate synthase (NADPH/NADH) small chain
VGRPTGFMEHARELPRRRPIPVRVRDWREVYEALPDEALRTQAARCMDCGVPFCHAGCPLGNLIPEWNELVERGDWANAAERLHATNNFPEFTGRLCPAPCEASCVLGIGTDPVTIERIEQDIAERAWSEGWVTPVRSLTPTGRRVAVVGSGPAGLACAQQLARAGHAVTVFERAARPGGLLRYGIPEFKMEKRVLDRRVDQLRAEGVAFVCSVSVGTGHPDRARDGGGGWPLAALGLGTGTGPGDPGPEARTRFVPVEELRARFDAVVLATGAGVPRDLDVPGRSLRGVHFALEYLKPANLVQEGTLTRSPVDAAGRRVVIVGGGDTGADCLGTAHRQGAVSVHQLEILPEPPPARSAEHPWPVWPVVLRTSAAHEEGGRRLWSASPVAVLDDGSGAVGGLRFERVRPAPAAGGGFEPVPGAPPVELACDLVLLAMGFLGPESDGVVGELDLRLDLRGSVAVDGEWATGAEGVFACGDMVRGQSLIVWAIAEGRAAAASVDRWLMGRSELPVPIAPGQLALR